MSTIPRPGRTESFQHSFNPSDAPAWREARGGDGWDSWRSKVTTESGVDEQTTGEEYYGQGIRDLVYGALDKSTLTPDHRAVQGLTVRVSNYGMQSHHGGEFNPSDPNYVRIRSDMVNGPQGLLHEIGHRDSKLRGLPHSAYDTPENRKAEERYASGFEVAHRGSNRSKYTDEELGFMRKSGKTDEDIKLREQGLMQQRQFGKQRER